MRSTTIAVYIVVYLPDGPSWEMDQGYGSAVRRFGRRSDADRFAASVGAEVSEHDVPRKVAARRGIA